MVVQSIPVLHADIGTQQKHGFKLPHGVKQGGRASGDHALMRAPESVSGWAERLGADGCRGVPTTKSPCSISSCTKGSYLNVWPIQLDPHHSPHPTPPAITCATRPSPPALRPGRAERLGADGCRGVPTSKTPLQHIKLYQGLPSKSVANTT